MPYSIWRVNRIEGRSNRSVTGRAAKRPGRRRRKEDHRAGRVLAIGKADLHLMFDSLLGQSQASSVFSLVTFFRRATGRYGSDQAMLQAAHHQRLRQAEADEHQPAFPLVALGPRRAG